ncbi:MAG: phenylacetate--CoA ligase [Clostridia bacterium]|nr:phenylacetate--CoA ligase [Clostridia bacterium]
MSQKYWNEQIETAPREQLDKMQLERLQKTVKHVYDNVPLYRERMDAAGVKPEDVKTLDDICRLPFTSKQDLRDTYPYGMFAVPMEDVVRLHASSGTTGKQIVVGYTQNDLDIWDEICARALVAAGGTKADKVHVSYGYGLFTGGLGLHGGASKLGATCIPVSSGNTARQITILQDFGSDILCCTPSYAMYIGEEVEKAGIDSSKLPLRAGIFGAEPWTEEMRRQIEKKLNIKAYDIYGLTEIMGPGVSYECECQKGMHVNEDHFIIEIINPDTGMPVPDGEQGEIVFSCITKEAFPLLRFRTKDIGVITHEKCECGRTFVRMSKPRGRTDDMLIIRGVNVFPSQIETVVLRMGYAPNYQLIVDRVNNLDTLEVRLEMTPELFSDVTSELEATQRNIANELKNLLGVSAKVTLVAPGSITRSEGKAVRVIDHRKLHD